MKSTNNINAKIGTQKKKRHLYTTITGADSKEVPRRTEGRQEVSDIW